MTAGIAMAATDGRRQLRLWPAPSPATARPGDPGTDAAGACIWLRWADLSATGLLPGDIVKLWAHGESGGCGGWYFARVKLMAGARPGGTDGAGAEADEDHLAQAVASAELLRNLGVEFGGSRRSCEAGATAFQPVVAECCVD